jgi:hypothetical protein
MKPAAVTLVKTSAEYRPHLGNVSQLFEAVFRRPFPREGWEHWYLRNPSGEPWVVLAHSDGRLVGHHALVPQRLVRRGDERLEYRLSMSTMVHPEFRNLLLFLDMMDLAHETASAEGLPFILGFPNANSAPLDLNLYNYQSILETELYDWAAPAAASVRISDLTAPVGPVDVFAFPVEDTEYWKWRTLYNRARLVRVNDALDVVFKTTGDGALTVLDAHLLSSGVGPECLAGLARTLGLGTVRLASYHARQIGLETVELSQHDGYTIRFFGYPVRQPLPSIRFSLLLSDVF